VLSVSSCPSTREAMRLVTPVAAIDLLEAFRSSGTARPEVSA
jgi:hypothetical protein